MSTIRKPAVAGAFYPELKDKLLNEINHYLNIAKPIEQFENVFGVISPHAGYIYSGKTAAFSYNAIAGKNYKTVIIISPSHREYFQGSCIYDGDAYETPLGIVEVDKQMREKLVNLDGSIFAGLNGHRSEHALEVQIPFLQVVLKNFQIVPIVIGDQRKEFVYELGVNISQVVDDSTLIVASSDLSHFYPKVIADKKDSVIQRRIEKFDYETLQLEFESQKCEACGGGPMVALMKAADLKGYHKAKVLYRNDSSETSGDVSEVVGYLSAIIYA